MTTIPSFGRAALAVALGLTALAAPALGQGPDPGRDAKPSPAAASCRYANPQYAGACVVQRAEGETCATILAYLNDPRSQGKTYCGNTTIRGGWTLAKRSPKKRPASPSPSPTPR